MTESFDHIVVGGGSAGCVVANRLVSEHDASVLLLEAGGSHRRPLVDIPAGAFKMMFGGGDYLVRYESPPQSSLGGRTVEVAQGNLLGGGSSVNAMTYMRGTANDYDRWDAMLGGAGWNWDDLLPYFVRQEGNGRLGGPSHGTQGPFKVEDHRYVCSVANLFLEGMDEMGIQRRDDFNGGQTSGAGLTQISASTGRRCSAANAFLDPLARDRRLAVRTGAAAEAILFEDRRAVGVRYFDDSALRDVRCTGEIFLTAGAYNSPKLLMLSGLGNAEELSALGIPAFVDLPGVGQNMQDHNMVPLMALTEPGHGYHNEDRGTRLAWNALRYALFRRGPMASNGSEAVAFVNPDNRAAKPTIQIYCMGFLPPGVSDEPGMMLCPTLIQPKSRGWMRLASASPRDRPVISPNYFSDPDDLALMVRSVRYCRKILRSGSLREIVKTEIAPGVGAQGTHEIAEYCRSGTFTNYHPVGSCRLGTEDDPMAVVDARLRVRGVDRLRVCDASVMPRIPSANTNAPVMAIADKCVDLWAEDSRS
jgi:choline dehydrogenase-like flavoprotein